MAGPLTPAEFVKRLARRLKGKPDTAYPLAYFFSHYNQLDKKRRVKPVRKIGSQGQRLFNPEDLVFSEDQSKLLGANGKEVTSCR